MVLDRGVDRGAASLGGCERGGDFWARGVLGEKTASAGAEGLDDAVIVGVGGQDDHFRRGAALGEAAGGFDSVAAGHAQVHQDDVGVQLLDKRERFLAVTGTTRTLDSETSLTVYRVAQEALTNIRKHARPERVELTLRYDTDGTRLTVDDHAKRPAEPDDASRLGGGGYGLTGMRERAELLGGSLEAGHTPDGFRVELWIPA